MQGKITGIDITGNQIIAVQVKTGLKGPQILSWARVAIEDGGLNEALESLSGSPVLKSDRYLATIPGDHVSFRNVQMPFKDVKKIRQALPFEMENMLPFQIEDLLIDFIITDGLARGEVLAASCNRRFVSEYLDTLQRNGIDPDALEIRCSPLASWLLRQPGTPEHILLLEIGETSNTMVLCLNRSIALIRVFGSNNASIIQSTPKENGTSSDLGAPPPEEVEACFKFISTTIRSTVHAFASEKDTLPGPEKLFFTGAGSLAPNAEGLLSQFLGMPAEQLDMSNDKKIRVEGNIVRNWSPALMNGPLSLALRNTRGGEGFNFRREEFERKRGYFGLKKAAPKMAVFLFLIFSFLAADMVIDYYTLKKEYKILNREITSVFKQTLPEVTRIVDPVQQLRVKVKELKQSTSLRPEAGTSKKVLDLLKEISQRIPASLKVHVNRMVIDTETVRISGKTDAFNEVDRIKNNLESSIQFSGVTISSANLDRTGKGVRFEIRIERKQ